MTTPTIKVAATSPRQLFGSTNYLYFGFVVGLDMNAGTSRIVAEFFNIMDPKGLSLYGVPITYLWFGHWKFFQSYKFIQVQDCSPNYLQLRYCVSPESQKVFPEWLLMFYHCLCHGLWFAVSYATDLMPRPFSPHECQHLLMAKATGKFRGSASDVTTLEIHLLWRLCHEVLQSSS